MVEACPVVRPSRHLEAVQEMEQVQAPVLVRGVVLLAELRHPVCSFRLAASSHPEVSFHLEVFLLVASWELAVWWRLTPGRPPSSQPPSSPARQPCYTASSGES